MFVQDDTTVLQYSLSLCTQVFVSFVGVQPCLAASERPLLLPAVHSKTKYDRTWLYGTPIKLTVPLGAKSLFYIVIFMDIGLKGKRKCPA
jgi:hypothetical protein